LKSENLKKKEERGGRESRDGEEGAFFFLVFLGNEWLFAVLLIVKM